MRKAAQFPEHPADALGAAGGDGGFTAAELPPRFTDAELSGDQAGAKQPEPAAQSSQI